MTPNITRNADVLLAYQALEAALRAAPGAATEAHFCAEDLANLSLELARAAVLDLEDVVTAPVTITSDYSVDDGTHLKATLEIYTGDLYVEFQRKFEIDVLADYLDQDQAYPLAAALGVPVPAEQESADFEAWLASEHGDLLTSRLRVIYDWLERHLGQYKESAEPLTIGIRFA